MFGKAFRILISLRKVDGWPWVVKQNFHENFWVNVTWLFTFFSGLVN